MMLSARARVFMVVLGLGACSLAESDDRQWREVYRDEQHVVAFDPDDIARLGSASHLVWYRTDHAQPRLRDGRAWSREITNAVLRCEGLWFKLRSVDLSDGNRVISRQRASSTELTEQPWRRVARGTGEEVVARAVCSHIREADARIPAR